MINDKITVTFSDRLYSELKKSGLVIHNAKKDSYSRVAFVGCRSDWSKLMAFAKKERLNSSGVDKRSWTAAIHQIAPNTIEMYLHNQICINIKMALKSNGLTIGMTRNEKKEFWRNNLPSCPDYLNN